MARLVLGLLVVAVCAPCVMSAIIASMGERDHQWVIFENRLEDFRSFYRIRTRLKKAFTDGKLPYVPTGQTSAVPLADWLRHVDECADYAAQNSIGFHILTSGDTSPGNGVTDDDALTLNGGWVDHRPQRLEVSDTHARASAYMVCVFFVEPRSRLYGRGAGTLLKAAAKLVVNAFSTFKPLETRSNIGNLQYILGHALRDDQICWNFVDDVHDLLYHAKQAEYSDPTEKALQNVVKEIFGVTGTLPLDSSLASLPAAQVALLAEPASDKATALSSKMCGIASGPGDKFVWSYQASKTTPEIAGPVFNAFDSKSFEGKSFEMTEARQESGLMVREVQQMSAQTSQDLAIGLDTSINPGEHTLFQMKENPSDKPDPSSSSTSIFGASMNSLRAFSTASTTVTAYYALRSLHWAHEVTNANVHWLEQKLGSVGRVIGTILTNLVQGWDFLLSHAVLWISRRAGLCPSGISDQDCVCGVVEPIVRLMQQLDAEKDQFDTSSRPDDSTGAITLLISAGASLHASVASGGSSRGMYLTFHWKKNGVANYGVEFGVSSGVGYGIGIGTDALTAGGSVSLKFGVFFGTRGQIGPYSKGANIGVNCWAHFSAGLELLFRSWVNEEGLDECLVAQGTSEQVAHMARMLVWPARLSCIRGAMFWVSLGAKALPTGISGNLYTSYGVGSRMSLLALSTGGDKSDLHRVFQNAYRVNSQRLSEESQSFSLQYEVEALEQALDVLMLE